VLFTLFQRLVESGGTTVDAVTAASMTLQLVGIMAGSIALSGVICYSSAYLLRHSDPSLREHPTYEISIILLSAYGSYLAADLFELSGILAVFFSGVFIRHYHMYNISKGSAFAFTHLLSTIAFLAENFIYLYLGISLIAYRQSFVWNWPFVLASFGACLVARAFNTFPLCSVANLSRSPRSKIPFKHQFVIWFSGLRGAIAFALALNVKTNDPNHAAIIKSSTLLIVLFTTVFLGMATGPLLACLRLTGDNDANIASEKGTHPINGENGWGSTDTEQQPLLSDLVATPPGSRSIHTSWIQIDEQYLKPVFGGRPRGPSFSSVSQWKPGDDLSIDDGVMRVD
jgi:sodium/hydrogen exchanger 8